MAEHTDHQQEPDEGRGTMDRRRALTALGGAGLGAAGVVAAGRTAARAEGPRRTHLRRPGRPRVRCPGEAGDTPSQPTR
jgi:hypothetical protein